MIFNLMLTLCTRRYFKYGLFAIFIFQSGMSYGQSEVNRSHGTPIRFSLNAYSFHARLMEQVGPDSIYVFGITELLEWASGQDLEAVDITGYYFRGYPHPPSDEVIRAVKVRAAALGLSISGTGIRNDFASADPAVREAGVALAKQWIDVAAKLGAPVIRLFAGNMPAGYAGRWDEVMAWMAPCFRECAKYGARRGVRIGIQNHADALSTADQCLRLLRAIDSKWVGLIVDTGSFTTPDPYEDILQTAPYAINWQVKERLYGMGTDRKTDMLRIMKILQQAGYRGFVPVETLPEKGKTYDPQLRVPALLAEMHLARQQVFR